MSKGVGRLGALVAVGAIAMAGVAYAAVPDDSGRINGCVNKATGVLRVIDTAKGQKCLTTGALAETPLAWNQTGPAGPVGATGPAGPAGAPGTSAAARYYTVEKTAEPAPFPDPLTVGYSGRDLTQGELTASCDPGDAAVSGNLLSIQDRVRTSSPILPPRTSAPELRRPRSSSPQTAPRSATRTRTSGRAVSISRCSRTPWRSRRDPMRYSAFAAGSSSPSPVWIALHRRRYPTPHRVLVRLGRAAKLTTRANFANSYRSAGRTNDAITLFEQVGRSAPDVWGPDHPHTLTGHLPVGRTGGYDA